MTCIFDLEQSFLKISIYCKSSTVNLTYSTYFDLRRSWQNLEHFWAGFWSQSWTCGVTCGGSFIRDTFKRAMHNSLVVWTPTHLKKYATVKLDHENSPGFIRVKIKRFKNHQVDKHYRPRKQLQIINKWICAPLMHLLPACSWHCQSLG